MEHRGGELHPHRCLLHAAEHVALHHAVKLPRSILRHLFGQLCHGQRGYHPDVVFAAHVLSLGVGRGRQTHAPRPALKRRLDRRGLARHGKAGIDKGYRALFALLGQHFDPSHHLQHGQTVPHERRPQPGAVEVAAHKQDRVRPRGGVGIDRSDDDLGHIPRRIKSSQSQEPDQILVPQIHVLHEQLPERE